MSAPHALGDNHAGSQQKRFSTRCSGKCVRRMYVDSGGRWLDLVSPTPRVCAIPPPSHRPSLIGECFQKLPGIWKDRHSFDRHPFMSRWTGLGLLYVCFDADANDGWSMLCLSFDAWFKNGSLLFRYSCATFLSAQSKISKTVLPIINMISFSSCVPQCVSSAL